MVFFTSSIRKHPWISSVISIVIIIQVVELILLVRKHGFFTPAFLQPYSVESFPDRLLFFSASIYGDLFLYGTIALVCFFIASLLKKKHLIAAYHFFFSVTVLSLTALLAKYKALSYMSDTINFAIIKNIAGGSLLSALNYVADEAAIIVVLLLLALVTHWVGYRWLKKHINAEAFVEQSNEPFLLKHIIFAFTTALAGLVFVMVLVQHHDNVRYGVIKKNSYSLIINVLDSATDLDRDGYGYFSFPADPAVFDSNVYPGAVDIPNNGIDEDMLLGDFKRPEKEYSLDYSEVASNFDYVFFIVLESAREEMLSKKINSLVVSPNVQKIAETGTVFANTYSHTGFTVSSLKAMFNGELTSQRHRESLFEMLKKIGYDINVFSGQAESFGGISKETNMKKTADYFFDAETNIEERVYANTDPGTLRLSEETVLNGVTNHLTQVDPIDKHFYYINFQAAHFSYHHPNMKNLLGISPIPRNKISQKNQEWVEDTYWNAVAVADNAVGGLVTHLKKLGIYNKSLIVITADHGESLFEIGDEVLGHGHRINDQQLKIPFVTNVKTSPIGYPLGQTDMREILLDLINLDQDMTLTKNKIKDRLAVFHVIGSISEPVQISHTHNDDRIIFDFRTRKIMLESIGYWQQIDAIVKHPQYSEMFSELIFEWEYLNYKNSLIPEEVVSETEP